MKNEQIATELLKVARELITAKMNQRGYKFYIVVDGHIDSGWDYREDAKDANEDLPKKGKILQKTGLKRVGLNPDNDEDWA